MKYKKGEMLLLECEYEGDIKQFADLHKVRIRIMSDKQTEGIQLVVHDEILHSISEGEKNGT
jgi:hypothetical protein